MIQKGPRFASAWAQAASDRTPPPAQRSGRRPPPTMLNEAIAMYKLYPHLGFAGQAALGTTVERVDAWPMLYMAFEAGQSIVTHLRRVLGPLLHTITSERAPGFGVEGDGSHMQVLPQSAISFSSRQRYFEVASALYSEFCVLRSAATEAQAPTGRCRL